MSVKKVPDGYHTVTPYLVVANAAKMIDFLKAAFGAEEIFRHAAPDGSVGHAEMKLGTSMIMLGGASPEHKPMPAMFYLYVEDADAMHARAIAAGATEKMPVSTQFYGDRSGAVIDAWGNWWQLATHVEDVSSEEMNKRAAAAAEARKKQS